MNHCVKQIRNALNDNADTPLYVETLPRRGYRFLAPVTSKEVPAPAPRVIESGSACRADCSRRAGETGQHTASACDRSAGDLTTWCDDSDRQRHA